MAHRCILLIAVVLASGALCGCVSIVPVDLQPRLRAADHLPPLEAPGRGVQFNEQTKALEISKRPMLHVTPAAERGATVPYDRLLWTLLRMPCFPARGPDGERCMVLIDTGLSGEIARVSADVAIRQALPSRRDYPYFAWVSRFDLAEGVVLREFPANIHPLRWEARVAGLPLYRHSGYIFGLTALGAFSYLEFDNATRRVTFGFRTPFAPADPRRWDAYPMRVEDHVLLADLPLAGRRVRLCPDTGGGPVPILTAADWNEIEPHVKVRRRKRSSYPAWEGFVPVDTYTLDELEVGNQRIRDAVVSVKTGSGPEAAYSSTIGLGSFKHTSVAYDFKNMKLWVRKG